MEHIDPRMLSDGRLARPVALVVDDDPVGRIALRKLLADCGYDVILAQDGAEGVARFAECAPDIVFMDMLMPVMDGLEATRRIKQASDDRFVPVIFVTGNSDEEDLVRCIDAGGDDFMAKPYGRAVLAAKIRAMERISDIHRRTASMHGLMQQEQQLAKGILEGAVMAPNVRPEALQAYLAPATTFNGDLLLSAYSPNGDLHVLLGDFTGHGLAATIGALPASETFRAMTAKGFGPPNILAEINRKLRGLLPPGRFLAAVFVRVNRAANSVAVINCGMPDAWLFRDGLAQALFASTALPLAVAADEDYGAAQAVLPVLGGDRILLVSDGAFEVANAAGEMFGAHRLRMEVEGGLAAGDPLQAAVRAIDAFRGGLPLADDLSLVDIHLVPGLFPLRPEQPPAVAPVTPVPGDDADADVNFNVNAAASGWRVMLELRGHALRETNPVPLLMSLLREFPGPASQSPVLFTAIAELYNNALDHGVLRLDSELKAGDFGAYLQERDMRLAHPGEGCVAMAIDCAYAGASGRLEIRVDDSGSGFDPGLVPVPPENAPYGRGINLVRSVCESLEYEGAGNHARAVYAWRGASDKEGQT